MTPFEFLLMLYVILAGLGLTLLVRSIGQMIEARDRIQLYWVHSAWVIFIFLIHVTSWFAFWSFRHVEFWTVGRFLLVISIPTLLYLVSHISVPELTENSGSYDMQAYFQERFRTIMGLLLLAVLLIFTSEWLLVGPLELTSLNTARSITVVALVLGVVSGNQRLHKLIALTVALIFLFGLTLLDIRLQ